jgi:hypothetical protein
MRLTFDVNSIESYRQFLRVKSLPIYRVRGHWAEFPDEYAGLVCGREAAAVPVLNYDPTPGLFDYQTAISALAIRKRKYCIFARVGLGKTFMFLEYARHVGHVLPADQCVLIVSPPMVIPQTIDECNRFYRGSLSLRHVKANELAAWTQNPDARIGITNWEALTDKVQRGRIGCIVADESSVMKSHYGKWGMRLLELGRGLDWKLCCTGTPAPNDRVEFANHAVFMDAFPTVNAFLAKYFVNKGKTGERWEIRPHAVGKFYRDLSHWCIFLENPGTYGWKDNSGPLPPIHVHIEPVPLTPEQQALAYCNTGSLFADKIGGITNRATLAQIAKGTYKKKPVPTNKFEHIRKLVASWPGESTIIWCKYNDEQSRVEAVLPHAASIKGETPYGRRLEMIRDYKSGWQSDLITKPEILGFGQNLQITTRMIFSTCQDSWEDYWQCIGRANRVGSTKPLNVHIPATDIELPMIDTVMAKAKRIEADTKEQEEMFRHAAII